MNFGQKIQELLQKRGWTQGELGREIGTSQQRISLWAKGSGEPGPAQLLAIARALGVPVEFLCDDSQDEPGGAAATMSDEDKMILTAAHILGHHEAMRRLMYAAEPPRPRVPIDRKGGG